MKTFALIFVVCLANICLAEDDSNKSVENILNCAFDFQKEYGENKWNDDIEQACGVACTLIELKILNPDKTFNYNNNVTEAKELKVFSTAYEACTNATQVYSHICDLANCMFKVNELEKLKE